VSYEMGKDVLGVVKRLADVNTGQPGVVDISSAQVDWRQSGMAANRYTHTYSAALTLRARLSVDFGDDYDYYLPVGVQGKFSQAEVPPAMMDVSFYSDTGNGRIEDDTTLRLRFEMEEGEIGQAGQYWTVPFTVNGQWKVREDIHLYIMGDGQVTQMGNILWGTVDVSPDAGRSSTFGGEHFPVVWGAGFNAYAESGTGLIAVAFAR